MTHITNILKFLFELFIYFHTEGFCIISESALTYRYIGLGYAVLEILLGLFMLGVALVMDILIIYGTYALIHRISIIVRTKEINSYRVTGTVTDKKHEDAYTTYTWTGKAIMQIRHNEKYNVYVKYYEVTEVFDDEDLFEQYEKNDPIPLILVKKLDKNDTVIEQTLELPE